MASRMLQPVLMTPNADTGEEGQSKVKRAMQVRAQLAPSIPLTNTNVAISAVRVVACLHFHVRKRAGSQYTDDSPCANEVALPSDNPQQSVMRTVHVSPCPAPGLLYLANRAWYCTASTSAMCHGAVPSCLAGIRGRHPARGAAPDAQPAQHHGR